MIPRVFGAVCLLIAGSAASIAPARAEPALEVPIRAGSHRDFGRIVFDTPIKAPYRMVRNGDIVTLRFTQPILLGAPPKPPRNVQEIKLADSGIDMVVSPGATVRDSRLGARVVVDVFDPPPSPVAKPARQAPVASPTPSLEIRPATLSVLPAAAAATSGPAPAPTPTPTPTTAPTVGAEPPAAIFPLLAEKSLGKTSEPVALIARRTSPPQGVDGVAFTVPFPATVGAAMFVRDNQAFVVFDERRPIDMSALRGDELFAAATVVLSQNATLIRFALPPEKSGALVATPAGWTIAALSAARPLQSIVPTAMDGRMKLPAEKTGEVVSIADPDTGATLLIGVQRRAGQAVLIGRRTVEFILLPTLQGVVVEPLADSIALRVAPGGFAVTGGASGLNISPPSSRSDALAAAARLSRRFEFSTLPTEDLFRQLSKQIAAAANAPARARGPLRQAAASTMLALGMAAEAHALLRVAASQDPKIASSPDAIGLIGIAALLAGRVDEADGIADPALSGTDDIAFWRGVRVAMRQEVDPEAVATFAATGPLILTFPEPIRKQLSALVVETLIEGGELAAADRILNQRKHDPMLDYARAMQKQASGDSDAALRLYDAVADGRDRLARAKAAWRAVELRLASKKFDAAQAADALDKLLYTWRGDRRDLAMRERVAELRQASGGWKSALAILREAEKDFPDRAPRIKERLRSAFAGFVGSPASESLPAIDFVAAIEENADLIPAAPRDAALDERLADRLLALELPKRADVLLEKLMRNAPEDAARAGFGLRLATLRLGEGDPAGALKALAASTSGGMSPEVAEQRVMIAAAAKARLGHTAEAIDLLAAVQSSAADEARATILEQGQDWPAATLALAAHVAKIVPETGDLDDRQKKALLRLATAAARADDTAALTALRVRQVGRMGEGKQADMFRLLTAEPIRGSADLPRAKQEAGLARSIAPNMTAR